MWERVLEKVRTRERNFYFSADFYNIHQAIKERFNQSLQNKSYAKSKFLIDSTDILFIWEAANYTYFKT